MILVPFYGDDPKVFAAQPHNLAVLDCRKV
jgi:hypothetical protein